MKANNAFTLKYINLTNRLISEVEIRYNGNRIKAQALWDTGATNSCISVDVVSKLSLISHGFTQVKTPSGTSTQGVYLIDVILPNKVIFDNVQVFDSAIGDQGIQMLIGMDIISKGDFAISNYQGKTTFTFRCPAIAEIDFVKLAKSSVPIKSAKTTGRNDPCPCGSGKKFKYCHGRN